MSLLFEVGAACAEGGRRGELTLPHGVVQTPVFMPVGTAATVKAVPQDVIEGLGPKAIDPEGRETAGRGAEIILANTYHLYLRPGHGLIRELGGVHRFMSWRRPMLTDSGGFQVFSLAKLRKITSDGVEFRSHLDGSKHFFSPEHSMEVQIALGADVMMAFDECVETPASWERTRDSMALTHAWAARSKQYWEEHRHEVPWALEKQRSENRDQSGQRLSGSMTRRGLMISIRRCLGLCRAGCMRTCGARAQQRLVEMDFPGYAIGGLAVGEPREVTREMIALCLEILPKDKPRYVMGVGYPDEIEEYARMGVDMMDCVLPTRAGRHGLVFLRENPADRRSAVVRLNIKRKDLADDQEPIDAGCTCPTCRRYSRAYLRHLFSSGEPLGATLNSIHNLAFYLETMERVRADIAGADVT